MDKLPEGFHHIRDTTVNKVRNVMGHLTLRDMRFLCLLAMVPTAEGDILEIGSFRGKSTIALAKSVAFLDNNQKVYAVDPMILASETDPIYESSIPLHEEFEKNLQAHQVDSIVEFHNVTSEELGKIWNRRLRLLWIDGDHTYSEVKRDFETFSPFLNPGAIVAFHDVLNSFDGPVRVMAEHVLLSEKFGSFGFCGSIGWSQYIGNSHETQKHRQKKVKYYQKLHRLISAVAMKRKLSKIDRYIHKLNRAFVSHKEVDPAKWINEVKCSV